MSNEYVGFVISLSRKMIKIFETTLVKSMLNQSGPI